MHKTVSVRTLQLIFGEKLHFTQNRLKSLRIRDEEIKKYAKQSHVDELREAKFLPYELTFLGSCVMWDDKIALFTSTKEGFAVVLESAVLTETFLQLFNLLWSINGAMETKKDCH